MNELETDLGTTLTAEITEEETDDKEDYLTEPAERFAAKYLMTVEPAFAAHLFRFDGRLSDWHACRKEYEEMVEAEESERNKPQPIRIDLAANRAVKHNRPSRTSDQMAEALKDGPATVKELCERMRKPYDRSLHSTMSVIVHRDPRFAWQMVQSTKGYWQNLLISLADN